MIKIKYRIIWKIDDEPYMWNIWEIGSFETIKKAIEAMKDNNISKITKIDDYIYKGLDISQITFHFKFWDTILNQDIQIESPWKIGLK